MTASTFERFYRAYGRLVGTVAVGGGGIVFAIMAIVTINVVCRRFFNWPLEGTLEVTELLMPLAIMLPMAYTQFKRGHIRVTILSGHLPLSVGRPLYAFVLLFGALFFAWVTWATGQYALRSLEIGEAVYSGPIALPLYVPKFAIAVGALLLSTQYLLDAVRVGIFATYDARDDLDTQDLKAGDARG